MFKSNGNAIRLLWCRLQGAPNPFRPVRREFTNKRNPYLLTEELGSHAACQRTRAHGSVAPRLCIHLSKSAFAQMEKRTRCRFTGANVRERIKPKTVLSFLFFQHCSIPKMGIRFSVPWSLCDILRDVIVTMCKRHNVLTFSLCANLILLSSFLFTRSDAAQSPGPCHQAAPRRFWHARSEEE